MSIPTPSYEHNLFSTVHSEEEKLRASSLFFIEHDDELLAELSKIEQASKVIVAITQQYISKNDDEGLIIYLAIRLVNVVFSAIKLALSGYYQQSFALTRDITETGFLVHYLTKFPAEIPSWRNATEKERKEKYSPVKIRIALDVSESSVDLNRAKVYATVSELGHMPHRAALTCFRVITH